VSILTGLTTGLTVGGGRSGEQPWRDQFSGCRSSELSSPVGIETMVIDLISGDGGWMSDASHVIGQAARTGPPLWRCLRPQRRKFARGRPADFKALWSHTDDVTLSGGLGGAIELGWAKVSGRLDWASSNYADGVRSRQEFSGLVAADFAYLVPKEIIEARIGGRPESVKQELRVTMVFRRNGDGWRVVHRHADSQTEAWPPR
jgi:ketosteroid isomerase-like protein